MQYKIEQTIAELSHTNTTTKLLTVTAWGGRGSKLDLRTWRNMDGEQQPGRGITLDRGEAAVLRDALSEYLRQ